MRISERDLMRMASAYVKNEVLTKWRFDNADPTHIDAILNKKFYNEEKLTISELEYISSLNNVIFESDRAVKFINFSGMVWKY